MKRIEIINRLIQEGLTEKTLANFTDKQINNLASRLLGEAVTSTVKNTAYTPSEVSAAKQKGQGFGVKDGTVTLNTDGGITVSTKEGTQDMAETLKGNQKKLDKNHNGVIDGQDFKILRGQKKKDTNELLRFYDDDGNPIKDKKGKQSAVSTKDKDFDKKTKSKDIDKKDKKTETTESNKKMKHCDDCGKTIDKCSCDHTHLDEEKSKPSAGLSKEKKSEVVKKAQKGGDIGKKGKGFEKVAKKAAEKYGSMEKGKKVAAAAMWKSVKREQNETKNWVKGLVENEYFHNFTSKNEIMELIKTKLNEQVVDEKSALPDFLTSRAIKSSVGKKHEASENGPATAPTKPKTKPTTKPGTKPKTPYQPNTTPQQNPQAEGEMMENGPATAPTKPKTVPTTKPGTKPKTPYQPNTNPQQNPQAKKK